MHDHGSIYMTSSPNDRELSHVCDFIIYIIVYVVRSVCMCLFPLFKNKCVLKRWSFPSGKASSCGKFVTCTWSVGNDISLRSGSHAEAVLSLGNASISLQRSKFCWVLVHCVFAALVFSNFLLLSSNSVAPSPSPPTQLVLSWSCKFLFSFIPQQSPPVCHPINFQQQ